MCFELVLIVCGSSLLAIGFGLGLLFGGFDVPAAGPAGIVVAILLGSGICVLLLAALRRVFPASGLLRTNVVDLSDDERLGRLAESRVRRAKLTVFFSAASTFMAFALFLGGIPVAFINFNFASGTNDIGLIMMFTGLVVGVIVIVGSLIGIPFGWIAGNASGDFTWFFAALSLPIIQAIACLVVTYITR